MPWVVRTKADVLQYSFQNAGKNLPIMPRGGEPVPMAVIDLLQRMVEPEPTKRISWEELRRHAIFQSNQEDAFDPLRSVPIFRSKEVTNSIFQRNREEAPSTPTHNDWNNHVNLLQRLGPNQEYPSLSPSQFGQSRPLQSGDIVQPQRNEPVSPFTQFAFPEKVSPVLEGVLNRIYHEKRVSMYFQNIANKTTQIVKVVPQSAKELITVFSNLGALLSKLALQYNAQVLEALFLGDNIFELPQEDFKTGLQSDQMQRLIGELTKDNEGQSKQLEQQRKQIFNLENISEEVVIMLFDEKMQLGELSKKIGEAVGIVNVYHKEVLELIQPQQVGAVEEVVAHLNIVVTYETQFKYFKETGLFNWNQFEKNIRDPEWVKYYLNAILKDC